MAKIREVEVRVKIYAEVLDPSDPEFVDRSMYRIEDKIAESVEKAINTSAQVANREGKECWRLVGVNATVEG
ncbi:hypothetical protein SEA_GANTCHERGOBLIN_42 [Arthrobacter phage GantcherGoblin]|nr:hypothetical protein SEA_GANTCHERGOBLIN_42 [Arthrobacter phage GantcherGoblin]